MFASPGRSCCVLGALIVAAAMGTPAGVAHGDDGDSGGQGLSSQTTNAASIGRVQGCSTPVRERKTEAGCYTTTEAPLGKLPAVRLYWHLYSYPTHAAANAARAQRGTVAEVFGKHWLYTIAEEQWRPAAGEKVAVIGPLEVAADKPYSARYMEAVFPPDFETSLVGHRHPGPEAWYVLTGTQCLETPNGLVMASAGGAAMVPEGWPMSISAVGSETRRALVLVLHPSAEPYSMSVDDPRRPGAPHSHWKPQGLCAK
jgi:quercetin dioxygenase-like cupin family protein